MPLSEPQPRDLIHSREIRCQGFRRQDGDWEIDGHLWDTRAFDHVSIWDQTNRPADEPVHAMSLRLTLDGEKVIVAVECAMDHTPCPPHCGQAAVNYQRLVGLRIEGGFRKRVSELIGGIEGCTHVTSLLHSMATTAFQTIESSKLRAVPNVSTYPRRKFMAVFADPADPSRHLASQKNGCYSYAEGSPVMTLLFPEPSDFPAPAPPNTLTSTDGK